MICGLSVQPDERTGYLSRVEKLRRSTEKSAESRAAGLTEGDLAVLSEVPMFGKCPRVVFVISAPENTELRAAVPERISTPLSWVMPNLNEARYAVVRHSSEYFTLSIFIQSSVVLCPEVQRRVRNFVKLCWGCRGEKGDAFEKKFNEFLAHEPLLTESDVET